MRRKIVELTKENLKQKGIKLEELLADGFYCSEEDLKYLSPKKQKQKPEL